MCGGINKFMKRKFSCFCMMLLILITSILITNPLQTNASTSDSPTSPTVSGPSGTINTSATVTIGGSTSSSGIKEYDYYIDKNGQDGQWQVYTAPIVISNEGSYTIYAKALSNSGIYDASSDFKNCSFQIIKDTPILTSSNNYFSWTAPDSNQSYIYNLYREGGNSNYTEGTNIVSSEDGQFSDGNVSSNWSIGYNPTTSTPLTMDIVDGQSNKYMKLINESTASEQWASLYTENIVSNSMYRLELDYNYPNDAFKSPLVSRNFGIVNKQNSSDLYNITVPNGFARTNGWQHLSYDFNSNNNTAVRLRAYADGTDEVDIANIKLIPLIPKSIVSTTANTYTDTTALDTDAPNPVSNINSSTDSSFNTSINITPPIDNGTDYTYYVEAVGNDELKRDSNKVKTTVTSGVSGYYYIIDQNSSNYDFDTGSSQYTESPNISYKASSSGVYYLHSKVKDKAGNLSGASVLSFSVDAIERLNSISPQSIDFGELNPLFQCDNKDIILNLDSNSNFNIIANATGKNILMKASEDSNYVEISNNDTQVKQNITGGQNKNYDLNVLFNNIDWTLAPGTYSIPINIKIEN